MKSPCRFLAVVLLLPMLPVWSSRAAPDTFYFTTLAGTAGTVVKSADGTGSAAQFDTPRGLAVDSSGNLYVADSSNHTIRKITPAGAVTTLAGTAGSQDKVNGTGTVARFNEPFGVAPDGAGGIFVADSSSNAIRRVTAAGVVTTFAGGGAAGATDATGAAASFHEPHGVAVDSAGNVYVADYENNIVRKITSAGVVTTLAGTANATGSSDGTGAAARFVALQGIAVDSTGNVFVSDDGNRNIRKITPAGVVTTFAGLAGAGGLNDGTGTAARFGQPRGLAIDSADNLYVADYGAHTIRKITPAGVVTTIAGGAGTPGSTDATGTAARFNYPSGVAIDTAGNVYVADSENDTIRKVTPAGVVTTIAGAAGRTTSADGTGAAAQFEDPFAVAVDSAGNTYVADSNAHCIRKVTAAGVVTTLAGLAGTFGAADGAGTAARFYTPEGVAVDSAGNVYVADGGNRIVRKVTAAGVVTTLAGTAGQGGSVDGTGAAARFTEPHGIAVDSAGNVYVSDSAQNRLRKITAAGVVTTLAGSGSPGSADGTGTAASFTVPYGVAVNSAGNLIVCDHGSHTIRMVTAAGVVTTLAGSAGSPGRTDGTGTAAKFAYPSDVAVDAAGNVYVADTDNQVLRKITSAGVVTTVAGSPAIGSTDGAATVARFFNPKGLAVDSAGNLLVADRGNHTIRKGAAVHSGYLSNLSVRAAMSVGQTLIAGFVVEGDAKPMLVRAGGPLLNRFGLTGVTDPNLSLYSLATAPATLVVSNNDWDSTATPSSLFTTLGAQLFDTGSKDAALQRTITGSHTANVTATNAGQVIAEVYDAGVNDGRKLTNLSARFYVGTGDNILIAGFVVAGSGTRQVLVRAVGPKLADYGVTGVLADPQFAVFDGSTSIATNNDWSSSLATTFTTLGAFALDTGSKDAAAVVTLDAGKPYTVQVSGAGGLTGEALVELYLVP